MSERILVCVPNWLGDSVMAMPAIQELRARHPAAEIHVLAKPSVAPLWTLHGVADEVLTLPPGSRATYDVARALRARRYTHAYVMPRALRAALIPWIGRVPVRIGRPRALDQILFTNLVPLPDEIAPLHQAYDYLQLLAPDVTASTPLPAPALPISPTHVGFLEGLSGTTSHTWYGLLPGAARGPSKQWPADRFVSLGKMIASELGGRVLLLGTPSEKELCAEIAQGIGPRATDYSGKVKLAELPALMAACTAIVCNDSGGMHLAAASSVPVVAIFGITDPTKTGPLGPRSRVLQRSEIRSRKVPRTSKRAIEALRRITPEMVLDALRSVHAEGESVQACAVK
jgi:heptosyltransferase II